MFKFFSLGTVVGLVATGVVLHFLPVVDQYREPSIISVQPNGGNREMLHVSLPSDRIMASAPGMATSVPDGLEWPDLPLFSGSRTEIFKLRNAEDRVVGVASRVADQSGSPFVEWTLHLPARGSLYLVLNAAPTAAGYLTGRLRAGTEEFEPLAGTVIERYSEVQGDDGDSVGRLELVLQVVAPQVESVAGLTGEAPR